MAESSKINPKMRQNLDKEDNSNSIEKVPNVRGSKKDDMIMKELLDIQAATIGTRKSNERIDRNANKKNKQNTSTEKSLSHPSNDTEEDSSFRRDTNLNSNSILSGKSARQYLQLL